MRRLLNILVTITLAVMILLTGCSKKDKLKKDAGINKKQENGISLKKSNDSNNKKARYNIKRSIVEDTTKRTKSNLSEEKMTKNSLGKLKSIKDDEQAKNDAIDAKNKLAELQKIYFDFDRSDIRSDAKDTLNSNADILKEKKLADVLIEGYCDERGTEEYNLALGLKRAESVKRYLGSLGVEDMRMTTISYGESMPEVSASTEEAWSLNRRAILKEVKE
ncbi:OmpA family protein [Thermodesulfobacteriota bacterium]